MAAPLTSPGTFSLAALNPPGFGQVWKRWVSDSVIPAAFGLMRRINPVLRFPSTRLVFITGFDAAQEVFCRPKDFVTPYQPKCDVLEWDNFVLAMPDNPLYWRLQQTTRQLWRDGDLERIHAITTTVAEEVMKTQIKFDFVQDFSVQAALAIVQQYYGVALPERHQPFFDGVLYGSGFVFGLPKISEKVRQTAKAAMAEVWPVIDAAMDAQRQNPVPDTVLGRYYSSKELQDSMSEGEFRSAIMAMIGGFLPTNTNGNGRILITLAGNAKAMAEARSAATRGDESRLLAVLHEAMRIDYILPMLWRRPAGDTWLGEGLTPGRKNRIPITSDSLLILSNKAAMMDPTRIPEPRQFNSHRSKDQYLLYGHDFHYCLGARMNDTMLTALFGTLLRKAVALSDKPTFAGLYPWNIPISINTGAVA